MINVKIKLSLGAKMPKRANDFASGWDCYAHVMPGLIDHDIIRQGENKVISLGFAMEIPEGFEAVIRPRSGLAKQGIVATIGTIDCDYRGVVGVNLFNHSWKALTVRDGERICQLVIQEVPKVQMIEVEELSETERGERGFGSSGLT